MSREMAAPFVVVHLERSIVSIRYSYVPVNGRASEEALAVRAFGLISAASRAWGLLTFRANTGH